MKTILIVDDEPAARYGLRRALEAKYRIAEADSAEAAREALPREQADLVLLDVVLPGQDGLSFLKWMREQGSEVPVLMVSALDTAKTAVEALQLGAADYLVKGFELEELRQRVGNLLKLVTLEKENDALRRRLTTEGQFGQMIGRSAEMRIRDGGPRGADGFHRVDFGREWHRKGFAGAGDSRALASQWQTLCCGELRRAPGNADRVGIIWLRARSLYRRGAAEKRKIRAGVQRNDLSG